MAKSREETEPARCRKELPQAADADYLLVLVTSQMTLTSTSPTWLRFRQSWPHRDGKIGASNCAGKHAINWS